MAPIGKRISHRLIETEPGQDLPDALVDILCLVDICNGPAGPGQRARDPAVAIDAAYLLDDILGQRAVQSEVWRRDDEAALSQIDFELQTLQDVFGLIGWHVHTEYPVQSLRRDADRLRSHRIGIQIGSTRWLSAGQLHQER